jgi:ketosteroid isomerase-like protein
MRTFLLAVVSLVALGSPLAARAQQSPPFDHLRTDWAKALESKDIVSVMVMYDHDAEFLNPDGTHALGVGEIGHLFQTVFGKYDATIKMLSRGSGSSGSYAYDSGSFEETLVDRATHETHNMHGDYLTVYDCGSANRCLIVRQVWTGQMPN